MATDIANNPACSDKNAGEQHGFCSNANLKLDDLLRPMLRYVRHMMGMEVAFISEFSAGRRYFRALDADDSFCPIALGGSDLLDESFCQRVVDGRLPELMVDARTYAEALSLHATLALPVGGHISVPVRFSDGSVFGTFCCFSRYAVELDQRDLETMRLFGAMISQYLQHDRDVWQERQVIRERILETILRRDWDIYLQPMFAANSQQVVGYEALCRFAQQPHTEQWFLEAEQVDLIEELEMACLLSALEVLPDIPADQFVSFNLSPQTLIRMDLQQLPVQFASQMVIELTEHRLVDDYQPLLEALLQLKCSGIRFAVDDAGAGFASFRHVLQLQPDLIKLDRSLISGIASCHAQQALARALIGFSREMQITTIAEGVETFEEGQCMQDLGVDLIQGYWLGRPQPAAAVLDN
ncbi:sensor domain-containing phosphodiesterase [Parathalassolituus penaei]|uniref:EAL domain-containing protein n=1 Tax=Parathalassolituus penaei TaxID=2997323 RepID=A0A9X3EGE4_9GAMM|nr:EAL domain-containing protein [Parathalassolituus penaei]MCY0967062.1 EAL domain-containing protein [Parathalassolituus penaei]